MAASDDDQDLETATVDPESDRGRVTNPAANAQVNAELGVMGHALATNDSALWQRYQVAQNAGLAFGGDRDYYDTLGYDRNPSAEEYYTKYKRNDIARTIVNAPASASWPEPPTIVDDADAGSEDEPETEFEKAVEFLFEDFRLLHYLERWDKALGIGEYGLLFLGTREATDGEEPPPLREPIGEGDLETVNPDATGEAAEGGLAYLSTFTQARVTEIETVTNPRNPRYGLPESYDLEFVADDVQRTEKVHHSRVLHAAEGLLENEVFGSPRLQAVLNRLEDLEKVVGGSAEMFWRGARRDLHLNYTGDGAPQDMDQLQTQAEEWVHDLRNVIRTSNVEAQDLGGQEPDPTGPVEQILKLIAGGTEPRIPVRILVGSERGELASTQDRAEWLSRIAERQEQFCEPMLLRPLLDRLIKLGVLPEPQGGGYTVEWPDLFELTDLERAELRSKDAKALKNAGSQAARAVATEAEIREKILGWDPERGGESSMDTDPEIRETEDEETEDTVPTPEEQDEFEDVFEELDGVNQDAVADGGLRGGDE